MRKNKKAAMELSIGAIVILILGITFLSISLVFIKGMMGKMFSRFEEQISQEPEPPKPTSSYYITFSRNPIKTKQENVEAIKISVLNPSQKDWINRQFIKTENMCGKVDGICFIDKDDTTGMCNTEGNTKKNDPDCTSGLFTEIDCKDNGKKSPCLMSNIEGEMYCPGTTSDNSDPNCNPKEGVEIYLSCDAKLMEKPFKRSIGSIKTGDDKTNIVLLKLKSKIPNGQYLCQLRVFAEDKEYLEDLVVRVENE